MDPRGAVQRLLELHCDSDGDSDVLDEHLDDTALELLTALCGCLSFAVCAAQGKSQGRDHAREQAAQCVAAIGMVCEVWAMSDVEIVAGPHHYDETRLCESLYN